MNRKILAVIFATVALIAVAGIPLAHISGIGTDAGTAARTDSQNQLPEEITLDFAYYSYLSLVLKDQRFLEDTFKGDGVKISWVFSPGANASMQYLQSESIDIGSGAGVGGLISFINGNPIRAVYAIFKQPSQLLVRPDSGIEDIAGLKGKTIAVTPTTNPYVFLLRTLETAGLGKEDVTIIPLQHHDGANALIQGDVDAWAGGDPLATKTVLDGNATVLLSSMDLTTPNLLYVRDEFYKKYPKAVIRVVSAYEKARQWAKDHPEEFLDLVVRETRISSDVGRRILENCYIESGEMTDSQMNSMYITESALKQSGIVKQDLDVRKKIEEFIDRSLYSKL